MSCKLTFIISLRKKSSNFLKFIKRAKMEPRNLNFKIWDSGFEVWCVVMMIMAVGADPGANLLSSGCSQHMVDNASMFRTNLNSVLSQLRGQLSSGKYFATASEARTASPIFTLAQCRNYMSTPDCLACFDAAATKIRNCSAANGGHVIYDGCFLRYESATFYDQNTQDGHFGLCGNQTAPGAYVATVQNLLSELQVVTPKINGYFAATKKDVIGGNEVVFAVAQCVETITKSGCQDCLQTATADMEKCFPNTDSRATNVGCFLRFSGKSFFADNQTTNISPLLKIGSSSKTKAIIAGVVAGAGVILISIALLLWFKLRRTRKGAPTGGSILGAAELRSPETYAYKDLKTATRNFNEEYKLGEGGFGEVYKGVFKNGKVVAVKKLAISQSQRAKTDFEKEVKLISNVHHRNLIRLLGCCNSRSELLLVYEYMANSSLDNFLYGGNYNVILMRKTGEKRGSLNWKQRFDIIIGTARGLSYLHEDFHLCIIHRDIKSNILLDDDFLPKIADFGLARLLPDNKTHLSTKFAGTLGYTAPEYAIYGQLSEKVDVYAYGVVVLEIISGRRSNEAAQDPDADYLLKLYETEMHIELVDDRLNPDEYDLQELKKVMEIALLCTQSTASLRPTMSEVVVLLKSKDSMPQRSPTRPAFIESYEKIRHDTSTSTGSSTSNATASISQVSGH